MSKIIEKIKYYCHKILPLTYDDSLSYYEVLCKLTAKMNELIEYINTEFISYVQQVIGDIFVESTYDDETETLTFSFNDDESETQVSDELIKYIEVNGVSRPVADAYARQALAQILGLNADNILIVAKTHARFSRINDAIDYAKTYCSTTNRVTIVIIGGYGVLYEEYIDLDDNPGIDFLGISNPIVRSSVAWRLSALRCHTSITCDGIWFENYYTPASGEYAGYGLHADPVTGKQRFRNCRFYSNNNAGVGIGMGQNGEVVFENCTMIGTDAVYVHNRNQDGVNNQWCRFYNCRFESNTANHYAVVVDDAAARVDTSYASQMGLEFVGCVANPRTGVLFRYDLTHTLPYIPSNGNTSPSYGNIFLVKSSICPGIPGLDFYRNKKSAFVTYIANSTRITYVPFPESNRYTFSINTARYSSDNGASWTSVSDTSGITLSSDNNYPDQVRVDWPGTVAGMAYELNFTGTYHE